MKHAFRIAFLLAVLTLCIAHAAARCIPCPPAEGRRHFPRVHPQRICEKPDAPPEKTSCDLGCALCRHNRDCFSCPLCGPCFYTALPAAEPTPPPEEPAPPETTASCPEEPSPAPARECWHSMEPTVRPTAMPIGTPAVQPTAEPTAIPAVQPTAEPMVIPSLRPTAEPAAASTVRPTAKPTMIPAVKPTSKPTATPTVRPADKPSKRPQIRPAATPAPRPTATPAAAFPGSTGDYTTLSVSAQEQKLLNLVNADRAANGLPPLTPDAELSRLARLKACDMNRNGYFAHESPTLGDAARMLTDSGFDFRGVGENIAHHATVEKAEAAFLSSDGHRRNILGSQWDKVGIGVCFDSNGYVYVTELFAR